MNSNLWHLAQLNVGYARGPIDGPVMAPFAARLDEINALADAAPGFVWRLQDEAGNATNIRGADENLLVNMSVWRDLESLRAYVYKSAHTDVLRRRAEWFEPMDEAHMVLWWVPAGHIPDLAEAEERLAELRTDGPGPRAFTFKEPYPPPA